VGNGFSEKVMRKNNDAMEDDNEIADRPADVVLSSPHLLAKGYRDYWRYQVAIEGAGGARVKQQRDVILAGKVVAVLPLDLARDEIVLLRQFRLTAHLANGNGDLVEIVAGRLEPHETLAEAARRECREEIGVEPSVLVELFSYLTTPGLTDEEVTIFLAAVDAGEVHEGAHRAPDGEELQVFRARIDAALASLERGTLRGSPAIIALQWLALNRGRIATLLHRGGG
jgi:ADP-ribose pyrophosphatase